MKARITPTLLKVMPNHFMAIEAFDVAFAVERNHKDLKPSDEHNIAIGPVAQNYPRLLHE